MKNQIIFKCKELVLMTNIELEPRLGQIWFTVVFTITFKYFDLFSANSLDVALSRMQHTVAVDGYYVYVLGGRNFRTSDGSYLGDPTFRYMDARTEVWGSVNLGSFCKIFHDSGITDRYC